MVVPLKQVTSPLSADVAIIPHVAFTYDCCTFILEMTPGPQFRPFKRCHGKYIGKTEVQSRSTCIFIMKEVSLRRV